MHRIPALIIGAGQAGLAMSHFLSRHGVKHVVLERGRIGERWHSERWDSLRLLTPNWASRLPGAPVSDHDPDDFMSATAFAGYLADYARGIGAPVHAGTSVRAVRPLPRGYRVETDTASWEADAVILATGHCDVPAVPPMARDLPGDIAHVTPSDYRSPRPLPAGGVLVIGASATGLQIAEEIQLDGARPVTLAVGCHTRLPRTYRGRDIWCWLEAIGVLDDLWHQIPDIARERRKPSFQLVGRPDGRTLDLAAMHAIGVRVTGRLQGVSGRRVHVADDLPKTLAGAQAALERLLARMDVHADRAGAPADPAGARPIILPPAPTAIDLDAEGIRTVVWATGYRRDYRWLDVPVLDADGEIVHEGGVTAAPGLYVLGLRFMRRRRSNFIGGVGRDAEELAAEIARYLAGQPARNLRRAA